MRGGRGAGIPGSLRLAAGALGLSGALLAGACGGSPGADGSPAPDGPGESVSDPAPPDPGVPAGPAPWEAPALPSDSVPDVFVRVWRAADNRATCALLAPAGPPGPHGATPRSATFGGGWGVAWDAPGVRSAFGVAGTGVGPTGDTYDDWPHRLRWRDGSSAGYGPEGGSGPDQLAYLRVAGQGCLYNVWSRLGREHLEALLGSLRFVEIPG